MNGSGRRGGDVVQHCQRANKGDNPGRDTDMTNLRTEAAREKTDDQTGHQWRQQDDRR